MSVTAISLYIMSIISFIFYVVQKYLKRGYLFSIFNLTFYIYTFDIIISPIFFYNDLSWLVLGRDSAFLMLRYTNESLTLNAVGYIIFIFSLSYYEFYRKPPATLIIFSKKIKNSISPFSIGIVFIFIILAWHSIVWAYNDGYPLLNGNRSFFSSLSISPIYLLLNECILLLTLYYEIRLVMHKQDLIFVIIGITTVALQGNRAPLMNSLLYPLVIMAIYKSAINRNRKKQIEINNSENSFPRIKKIGKKKKTGKKIFIMLIILLALGLFIQFFRSGVETNILEMVGEIFYGNTFCDIRDGALVLYGFENNTDSAYLFGKSYLAALISFIPSSISDFREIWSWGRYTTTGLFGMTNHFGFRGGNVMEAYINFSWVGVIIVSILQGKILATLEKIFSEIFIYDHIGIEGQENFVYWVLSLMYGVLCASSAMYNIYIVFSLIFVLMILSIPFVAGKKQKTY